MRFHFWYAGFTSTTSRVIVDVLDHLLIAFPAIRRYATTISDRRIKVSLFGGNGRWKGFFLCQRRNESGCDSSILKDNHISYMSARYIPAKRPPADLIPSAGSETTNRRRHPVAHCRAFRLANPGAGSVAFNFSISGRHPVPRFRPR